VDSFEGRIDVRRLRVILSLCAVIILGGCAASVELTGYPGESALVIPEEECDTTYSKVAVLGSLPSDKDYEEIGYMTISQESSSALVYTSDEKQIEEARRKACEWGADAIVIMGTNRDKGTDFWSGYKDQRSSRVVATRYK